MKKNVMNAVIMLGTLFLASLTMNLDARCRRGNGGAAAAGFFAGALTGAAIAGAAYNSEPAYYDTPVYEIGYPYDTVYGVYDYPTYAYYPEYAYAVDMPAYLYPRGYYYAYY